MQTSSNTAATASKQFEEADTTSTPASRAHAALLYHGGNLPAAQTLFPDAPQPWIDLSTGVNPFSYPLPPISVNAWTRLPAPEIIRRLERAAAHHYGASQKNAIAAPGSQALIQLLPLVFKNAMDIRIHGFTYTGHAISWAASGKTVKTANTLEELRGADVAIVVNPNNPDGRFLSPPQLRELAYHLANKGGTLIVDEAFMDFFDPSCSIIPYMPQQGIVALRSFGKAYGLAGLRLGFAICSEDLEAPLRALVGAWAVSGAAIEIGEAALRDSNWLASMRMRLRDNADRLDKLLTTHGLDVQGGTILFRLAEHREASKLFMHLASYGILVRAFPTMSRHLRFGIPGDTGHWERLEASLKAFKP